MTVMDRYKIADYRGKLSWFKVYIEPYLDELYFSKTKYLHGTHL